MDVPHDNKLIDFSIFRPTAGAIQYRKSQQYVAMSRDFVRYVCSVVIKWFVQGVLKMFVCLFIRT